MRVDTFFRVGYAAFLKILVEDLITLKSVAAISRHHQLRIIMKFQWLLRAHRYWISLRFGIVIDSYIQMGISQEPHVWLS